MNNELQQLLDAMNENNALADTHSFSPYAGYEITETRRRYHLLNTILKNGQRSGLFLIDVNTHVVYKSVAYGKTNGRSVGTVASLTVSYKAGSASYRGREGKVATVVSETNVNQAVK